MKTTPVFSKTLKAYLKGKRTIANKGGTRSSKTYSALQLFYIILSTSKLKRIITVVSHSMPHLEGGAIRDFETILTDEGVIIETVRTKHPYIYRIGKSFIEFVGFDRPGKALGAARDILFINEANKMPFTICHQLMQRTKETIFLDWNPSEEFWFDTEGYEDKNDTAVIISTFKDNIQNLTEGQLDDLKDARRKAYREKLRGIEGYWSNWWRVYGEGKKGMLEGVIFNNWEVYSDPNMDRNKRKLFGIDWGGHDPTTFIEVNIDEGHKCIFVKELYYKPQILNTKLIQLILKVNPSNLPVIYDSARKDKGFELKMAGIEAHGATKGEGSIIDGIETIQEYQVFIWHESLNVIYEFGNYKWAVDRITGKSLNEPEHKNNHSIDPLRYVMRFFLRNYRGKSI